MTSVYYNENDPGAVAWLKELMRDGLIPDGVIDDRSIEDIRPHEIREFSNAHFFAGIGGWAYALRLAGWPTDESLWTGSCPCQPFSSAGKGKGFADGRHLWPAWAWLIRQCRPRTVFGEQVASRAGLAWFDAVSSDLEAFGYACGAVHVPACGVGAPHIRQRLWFVAHAERRSAERYGHEMAGAARTLQAEARKQRVRDDVRDGGSTGIVGHAGRQGRQGRQGERGYDEPKQQTAERTGGAVNGFWRDAEWIYCRDGKHRPVEPGTFPLAHGIPGRVGLLRGYGNAIVPQVAAEFIKAAKALRELHKTEKEKS